MREQAGSEYSEHKIVLPPDLWRRISDAEIAAVQKYLGVLGRLYDRPARRDAVSARPDSHSG